MSSPMLLGSFMIQEKEESTHIQCETEPTLYEENEHTIVEEPSKYVSSITPTNQTNKLRMCNCCPYGFHIDLDFIRYCEELAANGKRPLGNRNKRRQRKSLEVMLGFQEQWALDFKRESPTTIHKPQFQTVYEVSTIFSILFYFYFLKGGERFLNSQLKNNGSRLIWPNLK